jgi:hypothetical protein
VVTNARAFYPPRAAAGATGTRLSLRPLFFEAKDLQNSGASRGENAKLYLPSLRANGSRECAPDDRLREAIHEATKMQEWIASLRSQ